MELTDYECSKLCGSGITAGALALYLALAALAAGIIKILCSKRGRVSFGGVQLSWGN